MNNILFNTQIISYKDIINLLFSFKTLSLPNRYIINELVLLLQPVNLLYMQEATINMTESLQQFLSKIAERDAVKLTDASVEAIELIDQTVKKQVETLKLKEVDQERLRMVVQL